MSALVYTVACSLVVYRMLQNTLCEDLVRHVILLISVLSQVWHRFILNRASQPREKNQTTQGTLSQFELNVWYQVFCEFQKYWMVYLRNKDKNSNSTCHHWLSNATNLKPPGRKYLPALPLTPNDVIKTNAPVTRQEHEALRPRLGASYAQAMRCSRNRRFRNKLLQIKSFFERKGL